MRNLEQQGSSARYYRVIRNSVGLRPGITIMTEKKDVG
jgi:hypothetical protein